MTNYEKDLDELKEQIIKDGDTLVSKRDLLERFCEMDKEYNGSSWNLLQILANIDALIGAEPCGDVVSRQVVKEKMIKYGFLSPDMTVEEFVEDELPPVKPVACIAKVNFSKEDMQEIVGKKVKEMVIRKKGHWIMTNDYFTGAYGNIDYVKCSCCGEDSLEEGNFCPNCGSFMREVEE